MKDRKSKHLLSKSTFLRGLQCGKSLYLHRYRPELRDELSGEQEAVFRRGREVGMLARGLFPGGEDSSPINWNYDGAVRRTAGLVKAGAKVIYEAAFLHDGILCLADILVKRRNGWELYEVKSSTGVKDVYLPDAALQYCVITGTGLALSDASIVHLNNEYVRRGKLDLNGLFTIQSVLREAGAMLDEVKNQTDALKKLLSRKKAPAIDIGPHCFDPYDCDFQGHCWAHVPETSVFNLYKIRKEKAFELYRSGVTGLGDLPEDYPLNERQRMQVEAHLSGRRHVDREGIRRFLDALEGPHYYMDFETMMPAVPLFDNARPYQQIPFQFCVYYRAGRRGKPEPREHLAQAGSDPREGFITDLIGATPEPGPIVVYNKGFESTRLEELARDYPAYGEELTARRERLIDLMEPFAAGYYYAPAMNGSASMKAVLPAVAPELTYEGLPIRDGTMAMGAYEGLWGETDERRIEEIRGQLIEYCRMDTYGMVRIVEELGKL